MDQCRHRIDEEAGLEPMLGQRAELPGNAVPRRLIAAGKIFPPRTAPDMVAPGQLGVDGEEDAAIHPPPLAAGVKIIVNLARHHARDAGRLFEILERRAFDRAGRADMHQQRALATGAAARDVVEGAERHALGAFGSVGSYGEGVGPVPRARLVDTERDVGARWYV